MNSEGWAKLIILTGLGALLSSCATIDEKQVIRPGSLAQGEKYELVQNEEPGTVTQVDDTNRFTYIKPLEETEQDITSSESIAQSLPDDNTVKVATETLRIKEFVHAVFDKALNQNYVLSDEIAKRNDTVTLSLQQQVSSRKLFRVAAELLKQKKIEVAERDGVFYIFPAVADDAVDIAIGIGNTRADVPDAYANVLQIIPTKYGLKSSLERTLNSLSKAKITPDYNQGVLFAQGPRDQILRLIDLVALMDKPSHQGKNVGFVDLTYIGTEEYIEQIRALMNAEGIESSVSERNDKPMIFVPLEQLGAVAVFSGSEQLIDRVKFWTEQIDKPAKDNEKRFYLYNPVFSRAGDLGQSIQALIGQVSGTPNRSGNRSRDTQSAFDNDNSTASRSDSGNATSEQAAGSTAGSLDGQDLKLTVDERSNKLIFYSTGQQYQTLLPIIRQLDVMPKQILLEATIAEITLTEEFSQGFEFAIENGNFNLGNLGAFGVESFGGLAASYANSMDQFIARLAATNSKVNVLSNPRLVVRDGVSASISVGTDIPTVGATVSDPIESNRQTTQVEYRKTGLQLTVTPTVNAQGLVVMEIDQQISNTTDSGSTVAGSPAIFERTISTEVLSQSGQTILLGGLISEDTNDSVSKVPGLGDIPVLGNLFSAKTKSTTKTELVIFITPRVVTNMSSWYGILEQLNSGLESLEIQAAD